MDDNPDLIVELVPRVADIHRATGSLAELDRDVQALIKGHPEASAIVAYTAILHPELEGSTFDRCVEEYILTDPTLGEFVQFDTLTNATDAVRAAAIARIKAGLHNLSRRTPKYRCKECGFSSMTLLWQCPSCKEWESQRPANKVEFDSLVRGNHIEW